MTLSFFQRLSFKLARNSLIIVVVLGLCVTLVQVYLDFRSQSQDADRRVHEILQVSRTAAARAVHTLDHELSYEVARGLVTYPFILSVVIQDDIGAVMGEASNPRLSTRTEALTRLLKGRESTYVEKLIHKSKRYEGRLTVVVDNDQILQPTYQRAVYMLVSGLLRNLILALVLILLFHALLTRPLFQLATNIAKIDYRSPQGKRIAPIQDHGQDEIGHIVQSANSLIAHLESHQVELEEREKQLRIILNASPNQVFAINARGEFVFSNVTTARFYKQDIEDLVGENYFDMHRECSASEARELAIAIQDSEDFGDQGSSIEQCLTSPDGNEHVLQMTLMPFRLYGQKCTLVIATDISARVAAEERVERLAYYDALTSLPNRNQLHEQLIGDIEYTREHDTHGAVLFIDIDDFKRINDTLGHSTGDDLLLHLSNRMKTQLRSRETLARLGGDEFILSIPDISEEEDTATEHAAHLAERLLKVISAPIELGGHFFSIGASIGIALYPSAAGDIEQLLRYADTAMYQAKSAGRNCYRFFEAPMEEQARERVHMESEIRQAISNNEFRFHLQPLIDASSQTLRGAEALIRWQHPEKGLIMPGQFIPYLEQSPMVNQVGAQILDQVCAFLRQHIEAGSVQKGFRISVNVSATEFFQPDFVDQVRATLARNALDGHWIELEITESVALEGFDNVINKMLELKRNGISFALDDFGTGFSSLNYLKKLPVDKIKIDKTFIDDVPNSSQDSSLVSAVIDIADNLNLDVVVEGVEEQVQADYFGLMERVIVQGYWFDKPLPPEAFSSKYLIPHSETV